MKKTLIIQFVFLFAVVTNVKAQTDKDSRWKWYAGAQVSIAAADLSKTHSWGPGVHLHAVKPVSEKVSLTAKLNYDYFFGKEASGYRYIPPTEPGQEPTFMEEGDRYEGMNDVNLTGGVRYWFSDRTFGDADGGFCAMFGRESSVAGILLFSAGYDLKQSSPMEQLLALFFGVCGDPKVKIGLKYSRRL